MQFIIQYVSTLIYEISLISNNSIKSVKLVYVSCIRKHKEFLQTMATWYTVQLKITGHQFLGWAIESKDSVRSFSVIFSICSRLKI
jgi:hypothetical protein